LEVEQVLPRNLTPSVMDARGNDHFPQNEGLTEKPARGSIEFGAMSFLRRSLVPVVSRCETCHMATTAIWQSRIRVMPSETDQAARSNRVEER